MAWPLRVSLSVEGDRPGLLTRTLRALRLRSAPRVPAVSWTQTATMAVEPMALAVDIGNLDALENTRSGSGSPVRTDRWRRPNGTSGWSVDVDAAGWRLATGTNTYSLMGPVTTRSPLLGPQDPPLTPPCGRPSLSVQPGSAVAPRRAPGESRAPRPSPLPPGRTRRTPARPRCASRRSRGTAGRRCR